MEILIITFYFSISKYVFFLMSDILGRDQSNILNVDPNGDYNIKLSAFDNFIIISTFLSFCYKLWYCSMENNEFFYIWFIPYVMLGFVLQALKVNISMIYGLKFLFNFYILYILIRG